MSKFKEIVDDILDDDSESDYPFDGCQEFPIDAISEVQKKVVLHLSEINHQTPDAAGTVSLSIIAAAIGKSFVAETSLPFITPANLYTFTAANTGDGKSAIVNALAKPFEGFNTMMRTHYNTETVPCLKAEIAIAKRKIADMVDKKNKDGIDKKEYATLTKEIDTKQKELNLPPTAMIRSYTGAALTQYLERNGELLFSVNKDCGEAVRRLLGTKDQPGEMDLTLNCHTGEETNEDARIARKGESLINPVLNICWMGQRGLLSEVMRNAEAAERGLLNRFLICCPPRRGFIEETEDMPSLRSDILDDWQALIWPLIQRMIQVQKIESGVPGLVGYMNQEVIKSTDEANQIFRAFHNEVQKWLMGFPDGFGKQFTRAREQAIRLALGQCVVDSVGGMLIRSNMLIITANHARRGVALARYFLGQLNGQLQGLLMDTRSEEINAKSAEIARFKGFVGDGATRKKIKDNGSYSDADIDRLIADCDMEIVKHQPEGGGRPSYWIQPKPKAKN